MLSGPAAGVVGAVRTAGRAGFSSILGFDMGGTSTDVCHYNGTFERTWAAEVAGVRLRTPMLAVHTVAAGGGSILRFDGARFRAGPDSAGADPGPACYRRGGPLTVTDANVCLGRIQAAFFPALFGPGGDASLDAGTAREGFAALAAEAAAATGEPHTAEAVAEGFLAIAVDTMAAAIKRISIQRGHDLSGAALCCFGGAGGQHACAVADSLDLETVFVPAHAGVLSAYGLGLAGVTAIRERTVEAPLTEKSLPAIAAALDGLAGEAEAELRAQEVEPGRIRTSRILHIRTQSSDAALPVPFDGLDAMVRAFRGAHRARYGFVPEGGLVAATAVAEAVGAAEPLRAPRLRVPKTSAAAVATVRVFTAGRWHEAPVFRRAGLRAPVNRWMARRSLSKTTAPTGSCRAGAQSGPRAAISCSPAQRGAPRASLPSPDPIPCASSCSTTASCRLPSRWVPCSRTPPRL